MLPTSRIVDKILDFLFLTTIGLIPVQLGRHFWPAYAVIFGVRHDLLSSILYLSDLTILSLLFLWSLKLIFLPQKLKLRPIVVLSLLPLSFLFSAIFSADFDLSIYKTAKLTEFALLAQYVAQNSFKHLWPALTKAIIFSLLWVSVLTIIQFINQQSLGLWLLGERDFSATTPGISQVTLSGQQLLRPYATFPHPNVLAGFLALSLPPFLVYLYQLAPTAKKYLFLLIAGLALFALLLTFSRTGWLAFTASFLIIFTPFFRKAKIGFKLILFQSPKTTMVLLVAGLVIAFLAFNLISQRFFAILTTDAHSLALRQKLIASSWAMFWQSPFLGVGPGRFLLELPSFFQVQEVIRFFQPVHNIYLLILSENGLFGLVFLIVSQLFLLLAALKKTLPEKMVAIGQITALVIIGNLDHYLFTLQQGQLLFWLVAGFVLQKS